MVSDKRLILVLGDQLSRDMSSLKDADKDRDVIVMGEVGSEATYVGHHKKKLIFIFSAMRHFAEDLRADGWEVDYTKLDADEEIGNFSDLVKSAVDRHQPDRIAVTEPGEWRVLDEFRRWSDQFDLPVDILDDERFVCSHEEFEAWAESRKSLRMEYFYREMRKKTGLLMKDDKPAGDKWNFDQENRKPAGEDLDTPAPKKFKPDEITQDVIDLVRDRFSDNIGDAEPFWFAVTAKDAKAARDHFFKKAISSFGDYQDAMLAGEPFLFHSALSLYVNAGLLDPLDLCERAEKAYQDGDAPLNAVEGFIRQIIGWREYMRGVYWRGGADYADQNYFGANRDLPDFFWTGDTDMACLKAAIDQTIKEAYAHHIQRLMVTGNFALIAGVDPHQVHEWYLAVYADAYEWVEAPNVIGMSQFADGGELGSKPYAASGAYINRMSNYCKDCAYSVSKKTEENACPLNSLYWDFLVRNEDKLKGNGRLTRVYQNWNRMKGDAKKSYRAKARAVLKKLDAGEAHNLT